MDDRKYQVFVSSTYVDLRAERDQVIKAVLELGHIPVGMEMFSAADEEQWRIIQRHIDASDYYVVIAAHRYGSVVNGVSYTEKEYDYAVSRGVPVLGFIIENDAPWPADRIERDEAGCESLALFKAKLKQKPIGVWSGADDLYGRASIALVKQIAAHPRPGWIRTSDVAGPEVLRELVRLSEENATLREQLEQASADADQEGSRRVGRAIALLRANKVPIAVWYKGGDDWNYGVEATLYSLFSTIAPYLAIEASAAELAGLIANLYKKEARATRSSWPTPKNSLHEWLEGLQAVGLVEPSSLKHSVKDKNDYWTTTAFGQQVRSHIRLRQLEAALQEPDDGAS